MALHGVRTKILAQRQHFQRLNQLPCPQYRDSPQAHPSPHPPTCPPCRTCKDTSPHPLAHTNSPRLGNSAHHLARPVYRLMVRLGMVDPCTARAGGPVRRQVHPLVRLQVYPRRRITLLWTRTAWVPRRSRWYICPGIRPHLLVGVRQALVSGVLK